MEDKSKYINILCNNLDKINWVYLSINPIAIQILEENPDKIVWSWFSSNPEEIYLLEANQIK